MSQGFTIFHYRCDAFPQASSSAPPLHSPSSDTGCHRCPQGVYRVLHGFQRGFGKGFGFALLGQSPKLLRTACEGWKLLDFQDADPIQSSPWTPKHSSINAARWNQPTLHLPTRSWQTLISLCQTARNACFSWATKRAPTTLQLQLCRTSCWWASIAKLVQASSLKLKLTWEINKPTGEI